MVGQHGLLNCGLEGHIMMINPMMLCGLSMTQTWLLSSQFPTHANKGGCHSFMLYSVGLKAGPRSKQSTNSLTN